MPERFLGSFFLGDLATARRLVAGSAAPKNLRRFLGLEPPRERRDLIRDKRTLAAAVSPAMTPIGRWPGPGRHPLVLLQQAAVNLAASAQPAAEMLPVNGPPGTGKTTLLRDLVAALVVTRAETMCAFNDPEDAFTSTGDKLRSGAGFIHIYDPDERLRGFEMLVASSNNKAVENVSRELPSLGAMASDATGLRYLKTVSDNVANGTLTWGLIAAVLGSSANRYAFREAIWSDRDNGLKSYLAEAAGSQQYIDEVDPDTGKVLRQRKPDVVTRESPPKTMTLP